MAEKLRSRYLDVLKERDVSLQETKRIRHDYDLYVKQNDQVSLLLSSKMPFKRNNFFDFQLLKGQILPKKRIKYDSDSPNGT